MRYYGVMVRRVAAADMGVTVGLLVSPLGSVEIMIVVGGPVRDPGKGIIAHVKQLAAASLSYGRVGRKFSCIS